VLSNRANLIPGRGTLITLRPYLPSLPQNTRVCPGVPPRPVTVVALVITLATTTVVVVTMVEVAAAQVLIADPGIRIIKTPAMANRTANAILVEIETPATIIISHPFTRLEVLPAPRPNVQVVIAPATVTVVMATCAVITRAWQYPRHPPRLIRTEKAVRSAGTARRCCKKVSGNIGSVRLEFSVAHDFVHVLLCILSTNKTPLLSQKIGPLNAFKGAGGHTERMG
jgi:hypothetical protein